MHTVYVAVLEFILKNQRYREQTGVVRGRLGTGGWEFGVSRGKRFYPGGTGTVHRTAQEATVDACDRP